MSWKEKEAVAAAAGYDGIEKARKDGGAGRVLQCVLPFCFHMLSEPHHSEPPWSSVLSVFDLAVPCFTGDWKLIRADFT